jgi:hypothetical protein
VSVTVPSGTWRDYEAEVCGYLAYCKRAAAELKLRRSRLDPKMHPSEGGAVKLIYGDGKLIREAYANVTSGSDEEGGKP